MLLLLFPMPGQVIILQNNLDLMKLICVYLCVLLNDQELRSSMIDPYYPYGLSTRLVYCLINSGRFFQDFLTMHSRFWKQFYLPINLLPKIVDT